MSDTRIDITHSSWLDMLERRGIREEAHCETCDGYGARLYGSTATWSGGVGGQMMTMGVCDKCWGSGSTQAWPSWKS